MRFRILPVLLIAGLCTVWPATAHHSFTAEFDGSKKLTLKGVVTKIDWMNPHTYFYIDVKDDTGKITNWALEGYPPNSLRRQGWMRDTVKIGDIITVTGFAARDGTPLGDAWEITLPDGRKLIAGPGAQ